MRIVFVCACSYSVDAVVYLHMSFCAPLYIYIYIHVHTSGTNNSKPLRSTPVQMVTTNWNKKTITGGISALKSKD